MHSNVLRYAACPQIVQYSQGSERQPVKHRTLVRIHHQTPVHLPPSWSPVFAGLGSRLGVDARRVGGRAGGLVPGGGRGLGGGALRRVDQGLEDSFPAAVEVSAGARSAVSTGAYGVPLWRVENFLRNESSRFSW